MNFFGNWQQHDVDAYNAKPKTAKQHNVQLTGEVELGPNREATEPVLHEADLHDQILEHCRCNGWYVLHSRMDRRSTITVGAPDFCIALPSGKTCWIECKRRGGKPTPAQRGAIMVLHLLGHSAAVVDSFEAAKGEIAEALYGKQ
jgi:hypothetical protein